jgi:hypothetical protein
MGQNKKKIIEDDLKPKSWLTKKCQIMGCKNHYKVNLNEKPDN